MLEEDYRVVKSRGEAPNGTRSEDLPQKGTEKRLSQMTTSVQNENMRKREARQANRKEKFHSRIELEASGKSVLQIKTVHFGNVLLSQ